MLKKSCVITGFICCCIFIIFPPDDLLGASAKSKYFQAQSSYQKLRKNTGKQKFRHNWLNCIKKYKKVTAHDPAGPWAAAGLYMAGKLYRELARRSGLDADNKEAQDIFERIIKRYPKSKYKAKAEGELSRIYRANFIKSSPPPSHGGPGPPDKQKGKAPISSPAPARAVPATRSTAASDKGITGKGTISGLRYWSNPNYTRIVIDADKETAFTHHLLKKDPSRKKPQRLYVDLENSRLADDLQKVIPINDNLLSDARAGQYTPESVRVVVDIKSFNTYKIFSLRNPFRIVVDVWGDTASAPRSSSASFASTSPGGALGKSAIARQLVLGVSRIVIDAGHGGKDYGAPGYLKGVHEKQVVLAIAKLLAKKIRRDIGCEVIMTRTTDTYLTLEERTAIANTRDADLFISIHTNSHRDKRAFGIETYFLNLATDNDAILVAARENATSTKNISDLQTILNDLMHNAKVNESSRLATYVQSALYNGLKSKYDQIKDKGVKQAPFYVLLGAQMPAVLVETSFISNSRECKRLINKTYQDRITDAIIKGVKAYIKEINPTAFLDKQKKS